jgi:hypothetical protein
MSSRETAFFETPVMRTVERIEQPSIKAEITRVRVSLSKRFMIATSILKPL